jgi:hypothetical protein
MSSADADAQARRRHDVQKQNAERNAERAAGDER